MRRLVLASLIVVALSGCIQSNSGGGESFTESGSANIPLTGSVQIELNEFNILMISTPFYPEVSESRPQYHYTFWAYDEPGWTTRELVLASDSGPFNNPVGLLGFGSSNDNSAPGYEMGVYLQSPAGDVSQNLDAPGGGLATNTAYDTISPVLPRSFSSTPETWDQALYDRIVEEMGYTRPWLVEIIMIDAYAPDTPVSGNLEISWDGIVPGVWWGMANEIETIRFRDVEAELAVQAHSGFHGTGIVRDWNTSVYMSGPHVLGSAQVPGPVTIRNPNDEPEPTGTTGTPGLGSFTAWRSYWPGEGQWEFSGEGPDIPTSPDAGIATISSFDFNNLASLNDEFETG